MNLDYDLGTTELDDLLTLIRLTYGYDFTNYARASLKRRVLRCMTMAGIQTGSDLRYQLANNPAFFTWFLQFITVNVTGMFRDPPFYAALREKVLPKLASYPIIKIWHAGCSTGEEVYSMAILLQEAGLLERCRIYATDLNPANLDKARQGLISLQHMKEYTQNYQQAGGNNEFSSYYTVRQDHVLIHRNLRDSILFAQHNLVTDRVFNEFQLVCCRNVLIYFNKDLQNHVIRLFHDSLAPLGYLAIGLKESLLFTDVRPQFDVLSSTAKIFRRTR
ncbi:protein-glutamate O-methyltransferase CheR [Spirosoma taeanense]|uniref:Protein-glutamate O-methyltransferase CheR n=1 Tax=Spirosoma taeanense TaxID=2735870 RepID=A0A6M5YAP3_9BACT|nr:protein-glutamate O-methyltransferase CheR [Spirosoma taeanense]QJW90350.1 protein-glutamate O-methyltransferase CheR [Spirosoma taeanense]